MKKILLAAAALMLVPAALGGPALAQVAAGAVPNSFDAPAQGQSQGQSQPRPQPAPAPTAAPDVARGEEALRDIIADAQGDGFDYSVFTTNLAAQIRQQSAQVTPLIKGFGAVRSVAFVRQEGEAQLFRVVFDNQDTEWLIGFDDQDRVAALLFRPAEE